MNYLTSNRIVPLTVLLVATKRICRGGGTAFSYALARVASCCSVCSELDEEFVLFTCNQVKVTVQHEFFLFWCLIPAFVTMDSSLTK